MTIGLETQLATVGQVHNADDTQVFACAELAGSPGKLPAADKQVWREIEANSFSAFGPTVTKKSREFFNPKRTQGKSKTMKKEAEAGWNADITDDQFPRFARSFLTADDGGTANAPLGAKADTQSIYNENTLLVGAISATTIALDNDATKLGTPIFKVGDIVKLFDRQRGPNHGKIGVCIAPTNGTVLTFAANTWTAEPTADMGDANGYPNKRLVAVGFRLETAKAEFDASEKSLSLVDTPTNDFTTLGLSVGETICIGGEEADNRFTTNANGFAKIESIAAHKIIFEDLAFIPADGAKDGRTIELYFGNYLQNGNTKRTFQIERTVGRNTASSAVVGQGTNYQSQVVVGAMPNVCTVKMEQESFVNADVTFFPLNSGTAKFGDGLCHLVPNSKRATRQELDGYSTQSDVYRAKLKIENEPDQIFSFIETATYMLDNKVSGTPALGAEGYIAQNSRQFMATASMRVLFQNVKAIDAIIDNQTCFINIITLAKDSRHAVVYDLPQLTLGGSVVMERGSDIKMDLEGTAHADRQGRVASITMMLHVPEFVDSIGRS